MIETACWGGSWQAVQDKRWEREPGAFLRFPFHQEEEECKVVEAIQISGERAAPWVAGTLADSGCQVPTWRTVSL